MKTKTILSVLIALSLMMGCDDGETTVGEMTAGETTAGEMTAGEITAGEMTAGEMTAGEMTAGETTAGETTAGETTAGEMTAGEEVPTETVTGTFSFVDYLLGRGLPEVNVSSRGQSFTSDADGVLNIDLPVYTPFHLEVNTDDYYPYHLFGYTCGQECTKASPDGNFSSYQPLVNLESGMILGDIFNVTLGQGESGIIISNVYLDDNGELSNLSGAQITLDTDAEVTVVEDANDALGLRVGTETVSASMIFVNVPAGERTVTMTPPEGITDCSVYPSDEPMNEMTIPVYTLEVSVVDFICKAPVVETTLPGPSSWTINACDILWPDDPFQAAVYSFVAEYVLNYGPMVGCYLDFYPDQSFENVAISLEDNRLMGTPTEELNYAQAWVNENAESVGAMSFDLREVFEIGELP